MSVWMNSCSRKSMGTVLGDMIYKAFYCLGDVSRSRPMTVEYTVYTQSLTEKPVKGMLTGPVTILTGPSHGAGIDLDVAFILSKLFIMLR